MRHGVGWDLAGLSFRCFRRSYFEALSFGNPQGGERVDVLQNLAQVIGKVLGFRVRESKSGQIRYLENLFAGDRNGAPPLSRSRGEDPRTGRGAASCRPYQSGP